MSALKVGFAGTPPFAAEALNAILQAGHRVPLVLTQPDRPAGRGMKLQSSAVKSLAVDKGLPVVQPRSLRLDGRWPEDAALAHDQLQAAALDVLVVAAYGLLLPAWVLQTPRLGCLNIHASLLPRWRGAAPIQRAIEAGDPTSGITIMQMDEGLDTGDMLLLATEAIRPGDTAGSLHDRLATLGARLIVQALDALSEGTLARTPQPADGVTYAKKIEKTESRIDWAQPAQQIERRIRAFDPAPGMHFELDGQAVKLWRAVCPGTSDCQTTTGAPPMQPGTILNCSPQRLSVSCGEGQLDLLELQAPGGRRLSLAAFLQSPLGRTLREGQVLNDRP